MDHDPNERWQVSGKPRENLDDRMELERWRDECRTILSEASVGDLEDSWTVLLGHQPTDHDKQNLYRIRDATKLKPTDAVWQLLIAFQYYEKLYEQFPSRIAAAARDVTKDVRATAEARDLLRDTAGWTRSGGKVVGKPISTLDQQADTAVQPNAIA